MVKGKTTKYYRDYKEDFVKSSNQNQKLPKCYQWIHRNVFYRFFSGILYAVAVIYGFFYTKFVLHIKVVNKKSLHGIKSGFFLYGNHTQPIGDVFAPSQYIFPKRMYAVASVSNLGIPVIGKILPMLGGLIIPDSWEHMKEFMEALTYHVERNRCIVIYPEAHVWPYCTFIRPYPDTSFRYPVSLRVPAYCMTTTYQKRRFGNKPKVTVYLDGPFTVQKDGNPKKEQKKLKEEVYACMKKRAKNSTYEYIRYEKES